MIKSFIGGIIVGALFGVFNLPIPAPTSFGGILGIQGLFVGYMVVVYFIVNR